jgi:hypothetical protein
MTGDGSRRVVAARRVVADIRSGMTDQELMRKYNLSSVALVSLFEKLVIGGFLDRDALESTRRDRQSIVDLVATRCPVCSQEIHRDADRCPQCPPGLTSQMPDNWRAEQAVTGGAEATGKHKSDPIHAACDVRTLVTDDPLTGKRGLRSRGSPTLISSSDARGLVEQEELDAAEKTVSLNFVPCVRCRLPVIEDFVTCPRCGAPMTDVGSEIAASTSLLGEKSDREGPEGRSGPGARPDCLEEDDYGDSEDMEDVLPQPCGSLMTRVRIGVSGLTPPAVSEGIMYLGAVDGYLRAMDPPTGETKWRFKAHEAIQSGIVVAGGTVYFGCNAGTLYALDANTGAEKWSTRVGGPIRSGLTVNGRTIYFGSDDHYVYAVDVETGLVKWKFAAGRPVRSSPVPSGELLYFGSNDHKVYALK